MKKAKPEAAAMEAARSADRLLAAGQYAEAETLMLPWTKHYPITGLGIR